MLTVDTDATLGEAEIYALIIGAVIARLRLGKSWTQDQLAERARVSQSTISRIELGERQATAHDLRRLAQALDVSSAVSLCALIEEAYSRIESAALRDIFEGMKPPPADWHAATERVGRPGLWSLIRFAVQVMPIPAAPVASQRVRNGMPQKRQRP